jgi:predicted GNAT family N-acyltransferase
MGTARWRKTDKGIKLERFAVMPTARKKGVGAAIAKQVLQDIISEYPEKITIYCHAQVSALAFWESQGFVAEGEVFYEANIAHYLMKYAAK